MTAPNALAVDVFMQKLQELSDGLFFMSESDYPLEPIQFELKTTASLTSAEILQLVGQPPEAKVEVVELPYFFRNMTADTPEADEFAKDIAQRFRELQTYLQQNLQDLKVYRIGHREIQVFILGKLGETHLVGLKTVSVET
jgi:hypothetical protein